MMHIRVIRISDYRDATLGVLLIDGKPEMATLEEPWRSNRPDISCIPVGVYEAKRIISPHFGATLHIQDVPNRSLILIHAGNTTDDTKGCILVGTAYGTVNGKQAVVNSRKAMDQFRAAIMQETEFKVRIIDAINPTS